MKILFVFYVPSGGIDTLNRERCRALRRFGVEGHCLYYRWGAGMQNVQDVPTHLAEDDEAIRALLELHCFDAIVVISDYLALPRFRNLGYAGPFIFEVQGYGPKDTARAELTNAAPYLRAYAAGLLNPKTPHISALFAELLPELPSFEFNNCLDTEHFAYHPYPKHNGPILAWLGRLEDNKNWREFLQIGAAVIQGIDPQAVLWMFQDPLLAVPEELEACRVMAAELNLQARLIVFSSVPHIYMPHYFSIIGDSGGMLISTSKVEGAPYAILEAMSCRCPVLTSDSDGVYYSVYHNETGKYYQLGQTHEALREARELLLNDQLREYIREQSSRHVKGLFSPEAYAHHFIQMLTTIGVGGWTHA